MSQETQAAGGAAGAGPVEVGPRGSLSEVARVFLRLGCTSFGGPVAHVGYLHEECVRRRSWLDAATFADLVALCQFLPGPSSSQLVFALGKHRAGLRGAMLASLCFTLPSAVLMIGFAYSLTWVGGLGQLACLHGLKLAAVVVVAQAVWSMGKALCPDPARILLALVSAGMVCAVPGVLGQVAVITLGAFLGWLLYRRGMSRTSEVALPFQPSRHASAAGALVFCGVLLVLLPVLAALTGWPGLSVFAGFYRAGALVFGGGHVILPLLRAELVPAGFIADDTFLAGYAVAQAVPGPLFTLAGFLGAVIQGGPHAWLGGVACLAAVFLPAWLLIGGTLPFWHQLRTRSWAQAGLRGANAAVVGVLLAALWSPVGTEAVTSWTDLGVALAGFVLLLSGRVPSWCLVIAMMAVTQWVL